MAVSYFKPNLNSLRPGYEIVGVTEDSLAAAGGTSTITFQEAFAEAPSVISVYAKTSDGVATVSVQDVTTSQIVLDYASAGVANDVEVFAIVQGLV